MLTAKEDIENRLTSQGGGSIIILDPSESLDRQLFQASHDPSRPILISSDLQAVHELISHLKDKCPVLVTSIADVNDLDEATRSVDLRKPIVYVLLVESKDGDAVTLGDIL